MRKLRSNLTPLLMKHRWGSRVLFFLLIPWILCAEIDPDEIDDVWLTQSGHTPGAADYLPCLRMIFREMKVKTFLQFGIGYDTKYFLDHATKVISIEFITPGYGSNWFARFLEFYRNFSNWIPIAYFSAYQGDVSWVPFKYLGSEHLYKAASYQCSTHKDYALNDPFYRTELEAFLGNLTKYNQIDIAFVSPPIYLRGDFIQILFNKVPLIIAHDTAVREMGVGDDVYGYSRIQTSDNYDEFYLPGGGGTTAWLLKDDKYKKIAEKLKSFKEVDE